LWIKFNESGRSLKFSLLPLLLYLFNILNKFMWFIACATLFQNIANLNNANKAFLGTGFPKSKSDLRIKNIYICAKHTLLLNYYLLLITSNESVGKPSSVVDGYLSRRGIAPSAQAAFRSTSGKCIATVSVAPNRVYRVSTFP